MAAKYPPIPDPTTDPEQLRLTLVALKQAFEILTGQRGDGSASVALGGDLTAAAQSLSTSLSALTGTVNGLSTNSAKITRTRQVITAVGAGTYTTPTGCRLILVRLFGAGGGGGGGATGQTAGSPGGATTFGPLSAAGGPGGGVAGSPPSSSIGSSGGDVNIPSTTSNLAWQTGSYVGAGSGGTPGLTGLLGGSGCGGWNGANASPGLPNTGAGGGGGGSSQSLGGGCGGGAGGYCEKLIVSPAASYAYSLGAGGAGGASSVSVGGAGGSGLIIVDEFY